MKIPKTTAAYNMGSCNRTIAKRPQIPPRTTTPAHARGDNGGTQIC